MKPSQFKAIRLAMNNGKGMSQSAFGLALGFGGTKAARGNMICAYEAGKRQLPATIEHRLAWMRENEKNDF